MLKNVSILGLLSAATLGVVALPASADTAVIQQGTQDVFIQGDDNSAVQRSQQINRIEVNRERSSRGAGNTGIVQDIYQGGTIVGDDNEAYQESNQINVIQDRSRPSQSQGRGRSGRVEVRQR
ncbi:hypothetical protein GFS31_01200 [Leptolyngbya sp. BL0902]|uniref:hypothetical protein n=1 Tax=Leptolyngbya sp. BL0902 TaxID=1115757 RepID=UPI0018E8734F|nr:hypothetical protein [Leptolyngbya sp. BL0902]QQE63455.1 hypothetical protein GFS31_01200 [Leptolyngbya sp. BL0902]